MCGRSSARGGQLFAKCFGEKGNDSPRLAYLVKLFPIRSGRGRICLDGANECVTRRVLTSDEFHDVDAIAEQSKNVRSKGIREHVSEPFAENSVSRERWKRTGG